MPTTSSPPAEVPALLGVADVAAMCGCSTRHIYRLADAGRMPRPVRLGSLVRWQRTAIDEWIAEGCLSHRATSAKGGAA